jgi:hypothetical protein
MKRRRFVGPEWLVVVGGAVFIFALAVSALFVPELRWLHLAQASMYVIAMFLSIRRQRWGYFIGASAAAFWNVLAMFASPIFAEMFEQFRPDLVLQGLAWLGNLAVVAGSVLGYRRLATKSVVDVGWCALAFLITTGFLVGATALLAPSYLSHIGGILHPHWPWTQS